MSVIAAIFTVSYERSRCSRDLITRAAIGDITDLKRLEQLLNEQAPQPRIDNLGGIAGPVVKRLELHRSVSWSANPISCPNIRFAMWIGYYIRIKLSETYL